MGAETRHVSLGDRSAYSSGHNHKGRISLGRSADTLETGTLVEGPGGTAFAFRCAQSEDIRLEMAPRKLTTGSGFQVLLEGERLGFFRKNMGG